VERSDEQGIGHSYADAPNRLVGFILDALILTLLVLLGAVAVSAALGPVVRIDLGSAEVSVDRGTALVTAVVSSAINAAYFVIAWSRYGASPGQRLLSMRIGAEAGGRVPVRRAAVRWAVLWGPFAVASLLITVLGGLPDALLDAVVLGWFVVLLVTIARSPTKQGLHDRLARTVVLKRSRVVEPVAARREEAPVVR
jgi:uncharacterized RDD family membrane protein YckC